MLCAARRTDVLPVVTEPEDVNQRWREGVAVFNRVSLRLINREVAKIAQ